MKKIKLFVLFIVLLSPMSVAAAAPVIYFHLPQQGVAPGSEFALTVFLRNDVPVNAFEVAVEFTAENLEFLKYDDSGSVINIWQSKPHLSGKDLIIMTGGAAPPVEGEAGELIKLHFRAKTPGSAAFALRGSNLYAADGQGTQMVTEPFYINLAIGDQFAKLSLPESSDKTPPKVSLTKAVNPVDGERILILDVEDEESGSGKVLGRTFENWRWSSWQELQNPVRFPASAWLVQIRAENGSGISESAFLWGRNPKLLALIVLIILISVAAYSWYNKSTASKWR